MRTCAGLLCLVRGASFFPVCKHCTLISHVNVALGSHWKPRSVDVQPAATSWGIDSDS